VTETVHLDTNALIGALVAGSADDARLRGWLLEGRSLAMSSIAWTEFLCGPALGEGGQSAARLIAEVVPFEADDADAATRLFNATGRRRGSLVDCMVAATAIRRGAPLATDDTTDFDRFADHGLRLAR
jgi:predicted nucleic acid-binding protein